MKKIITMVLAVVLLMTSVAAFSETHPIPNISQFAEQKVKTSDNSYSLKFTKPVDRLFINWTDGAGLEEMMVDENLNAFIFRTGHKYLAGIEERFVPEKSTEIYDGKKLIYQDTQVDPVTGNEIVKDVKTYVKTLVLKFTDDVDTIVEAFKKQYKDYKIEVIKPQHMVDKDGKDIYINGAVKAYKEETVYNRYPGKRKTNLAIPSQAAFVTLQEDEWVVYYNRSGKIVGIEYYDGQF